MAEHFYLKDCNKAGYPFITPTPKKSLTIVKTTIIIKKYHFFQLKLECSLKKYELSYRIFTVAHISTSFNMKSRRSLVLIISPLSL